MTFGFLVARRNGIHVANSAGNAGPNNETIGSPSDAPWLTVVASSTHDRLALNSVGGLPRPAGSTIDAIEGKGVSERPRRPRRRIVYAGDLGNPLCAAGRVGRGHLRRRDRRLRPRRHRPGREGEVAAAAGAGGFVLANDETNGGVDPRVAER